MKSTLTKSFQLTRTVLFLVALFVAYYSQGQSIATTNLNPCPFEEVTYSVPATGCASYTWTIEPAVVVGTITSGQGTNAIKVKWNWSRQYSKAIVKLVIGAATGTKRCSDFGYNGKTLTQTATSAFGVQPKALKASGVAQPGVPVTYSTTAIHGAKYTWALPSGWQGSSTTNSITCTPPAGTSSGKVTVQACFSANFCPTVNTTFCHNPESIDVTSAPVTCEPTTAASGLSFSEVKNNSMRLTWTNGNGTGRLVLIRKGAPVDWKPGDGGDFSGGGAPNTYGGGYIWGDDTYSIYTGTGNTVNVLGLDPNTVYHYAIFEYKNNCNNRIDYLTASFLTGTQATLGCEPKTPASNLNFSNNTANSTQLSWTNGDGTGRLVLIRKGAPVTWKPGDGGDFSGGGAPNTYGGGYYWGEDTYSIYTGAGSSVTINGLEANATYYYTIYEYAEHCGYYDYNTSSFLTGSKITCEPSIPAQAFFAGSVTSTSMRLNWIKGNGTHRLILVRAGVPVDWKPGNGGDFSGGGAPNTYGGGYYWGDNTYSIYDGTGTSVMVNGLGTNATYHFAIFEYNICDGKKYYLTSSYPTISQSTCEPGYGPFNLAFSNITSSAARLSWTNGDGTTRLVLIRKGSPVDWKPGDGGDFSGGGAPNTYGGGYYWGDDTYSIYTGTGSAVNINGLAPLTTYYFAVFEYTNLCGSKNYNTKDFATGSLTTKSPTGRVAFTSSEMDGMTQDARSLSINLYPNPAANTVQLLLPVGIQSAKVQLVNTLGQVVKEVAAVEGENQLTISGQPAGVYKVIITTEETTYYKSLVIVK